ncbi:MAG: hypothetical protein GQ562_07760 [Anaerolineales bacterium]|nr:hypothetical protein [Anaerolineales bacterium]
MAKKQDSTLPKIGYLYHYPQLDHPTDKFRLDIFISSIPSEHHCDVLRAHFVVRTPEGTMDRFKVTQPWNHEKTARVCAGVVIMEDRKGKKEEAFTFGGQLRIESQDLQTVCILVSPAPILEISGATPLNELFIDELEILLAEHRAAYPNHHEYETQLSKTDPFELYLACLKELIRKFEQFPHKDGIYLQLLMFLHSQKYRLDAAGLSRDSDPKLENIFKVNKE